MKTGKLILIGLGLALGGFLLVRETKKEIKKLKEQKRQIDDALEDLGISSDTLREKSREVVNNSLEEGCEVDEENDESDNLVLAMYNVIQFGDRKGKFDPWDLDLIRIHPVIEEHGKNKGRVVKCGLLNCENIIHVSQTDTRFGKRKLEFIFEIPTTAYNRNLPPHYPKLNNYRDKFNKLGHTLNKEFIGTDNNSIDRFFVGYYILSFKIRGEVYTKVINEKTGETRTYEKVFQEMVEIPKKDYESYNTYYPDGGLRYSGFLEFMQDLYDYTNGRKKLNKKLMDHIFGKIAFFSKDLDKLGKTQDDVYDIKITSTYLAYKLRFPLKDDIDDEPGVDLYTALGMLNYVIDPDNLTIYRIDDRNSNIYGTYSTSYNHVMFQARDRDPRYRDLGFNNMLYYITNPEDEDDKNFINRKIDTELMEYSFEEEESLEEKAENEKRKKKE